MSIELSERACFWCANTHNFTQEACTCSCHAVEQLHDKLKVLNSEVDWTIPQLYTIKKLLQMKLNPCDTAARQKCDCEEDMKKNRGGHKKDCPNAIPF